jgi:hypothetical protein
MSDSLREDSKPPPKNCTTTSTSIAPKKSRFELFLPTTTSRRCLLGVRKALGSGFETRTQTLSDFVGKSTPAFASNPPRPHFPTPMYATPSQDTSHSIKDHSNWNTWAGSTTVINARKEPPSPTQSGGSLLAFVTVIDSAHVFEFEPSLME